MEQILGIQPHTIRRANEAAEAELPFFRHLCILYVASIFVFSDGFGFRLGILFSGRRILEFLCLGMIVFNTRRLNLLLQDIRKAVIPNVFILLRAFVFFYTTVYRHNTINTIGGPILDEFIVFYLLLYIFKHVITLEQFLRIVRVCLTILCLEGIWEAATHINLFGLLNFAEKTWSFYDSRGGSSRICGPCHHSILFGILLSTLFFLSCYDVRKNQLYLFRSPILFVMTTLCVFLTGSRAPTGVYLMGIVLICLFSGRGNRIKSFLLLAVTASVFALLLMLFYRTGLGRQIMYLLSSLYDAVFRTEYSLKFSDAVLRYSTEYRDALAKVFQLDYFNKWIGRGNKYTLSVIIDGWWILSCDNSYVAVYIQLAYPGLATLIGQALLILGYCITGLIRRRNLLFSAILVSTVCYFVTVWYVAFMGTYIYVCVLFALAYCVFSETNRKGITT